MPQECKTLFTVQGLRAIAAASVVLYHVFNMLVHNAGYSFHFSDVGAAGVDLFFLISGFIMIYTHFDNFGEEGASTSFMRRRVIRIVPLYWLATTATVALLVCAPTLFSTIKLDWNNVASSYFFLLSPNSEGVVGTVTQTGWTLCYEFYFYVVFGALLFLPRRYFLIAAGLIFVIGLLVGAGGTVPPCATVATHPLLAEFYLGSIIAFLFLAGFSLPSNIAIVSIVLSVIVILVAGEPADQNWQRVLWWGLPCAIILASAVSLERISIRVPKILVALGASSYSLYLIHPFVLPAFGKAWSLMHLGKAPPFVAGLLAFTAALIVGHSVHVWFEKPMTKWLLRAFPERDKVALHDSATGAVS
jgi:peptidoglycan/LPS O-acetylase OafA/YrhL